MKSVKISQLLDERDNYKFNLSKSFSEAYAKTEKGIKEKENKELLFAIITIAILSGIVFSGLFFGDGSVDANTFLD